MLGVSRQTLYDILDEKKPVTVSMALRLGKLCGDGPRIWLALQEAYDIRTTEPRLAAEIATIPTLTADRAKLGKPRISRRPSEPLPWQSPIRAQSEFPSRS